MVRQSPNHRWNDSAEFEPEGYHLAREQQVRGLLPGTGERLGPGIGPE